MKDKFELNIDLALPDLGRAKRAVKRAVKSVKYDVAAFRDRDPAASSDLEVLLLYSGLHAVLLHRAAHALCHAHSALILLSRGRLHRSPNQERDISAMCYRIPPP